MGLETATWISDLVGTNPPGTDLESQGANHLRLIKSVLQNTFPVTGKAFNFPQTATKTANYSVQKADLNTLFLANTAGGSFTFTLPSLVAGDAGWFCEFMLVSAVAPYFVAPPSGTLISGDMTVGISSARRFIPGRKTQSFWTGATWYLSRIPTLPIGSIIPCITALPQGYEYANGQTLTSASVNYPDYFAAIGNGVTPDLTGRVIFGKDNVGGVTTNRVTVAGGNWDGTVNGGAGGGQNVTIGQMNLPNVNFTNSGITLNDPGHTHAPGPGGNFYGDTAGSPVSLAGTSPAIQRSGATASNTTGITISAQGHAASGGSGTALASLPPGISLPLVIIVE